MTWHAPEISYQIPPVFHGLIITCSAKWLLLGEVGKGSLQVGHRGGVGNWLWQVWHVRWESLLLQWYMLHSGRLRHTEH